MSKMTHKTEPRSVQRPADAMVSAAGAYVAPVTVPVGRAAAFFAQLKRTFGLFVPIFVGQLAATAMGVVDTVMAGAAGTLQLSGVAIGSSIFWPSELFIVGMALGLHPLVANVVGSGELHLIPKRLQVAAMVCLGAAAVVGGLIMLAPLVYRLMPGVDADMIAIGQGYLIAVGLALPAYALFNVLRAYWEGLGKTGPTLVFGLMALLLNIPLNWMFIFGHFGLPALGGVGCGVATALTMYLTVGAMLLYVRLSPAFAQVRLFTRYYAVSWRELWTFAKFSLPLGVAGMIETLCFSLVAVLLSPFGPVVVASHTIAMNVSGLLVIVPIALSAVASVEVGQAMGTNNWAAAQRRAFAATTLALGFYALGLIALILGRDLIVSWYSDDAAVKVLAPVLLIYCAVFLLPDTLQVIAIGILRGFKDARTIFIITVVAYWVVGMPIGLALGYGYLTGESWAHLVGAPGFWLGFICSLTCASLLLWIRIYFLLQRRHVPQSFRP
ncbi:MAG TPA: MATE family efflux transporter [Candidatus Anaerobiospirillum stercoravium]|nr:MATE family efflux transporter [Candidatus Anaerobiospirillum stercoravium]